MRSSAPSAERVIEIRSTKSVACHNYLLVLRVFYILLLFQGSRGKNAWELSYNGQKKAMMVKEWSYNGH